MNAKKIKAIRKDLRADGINFNDGASGSQQYSNLKKAQKAATRFTPASKYRGTSGVPSAGKPSSFKGFRTEYRATTRTFPDGTVVKFAPLVADFSMNDEKRKQRGII